MYAKHKNKWIGFVLLFMIISFGVNFFPNLFGSKVTISPLLIFVIIVVCNVWNSFVFQKKIENNYYGILFNKMFFINLAVTCLFSLMLFFIYEFSFFIGEN